MELLSFCRLVFNVLHGHNLPVHSLKCNPSLNTKCDPKCVRLEKTNELKYIGLIIDYRLRRAIVLCIS